MSVPWAGWVGRNMPQSGGGKTAQDCSVCAVWMDGLTDEKMSRSNAGLDHMPLYNSHCYQAGPRPLLCPARY